MEIEIRDFELKNGWDVQRDYLILRLDGINGKLLTKNQREKYKRKVTKFLWKNVEKYFPKIGMFLTDEKGGFNIEMVAHYNTPIICSYGDFYMKLIGSDENGKLIWEDVKLEPIGFILGGGKYFRDIVIDAVNRLIIRGSKMEDFKELIDALNETREVGRGMMIREKDVEKAFMVECERK
ncbi:MAG: hypothetical protein QW734_03645 [Candidatus Bathyarchaeia archaeon]